MPVKKPCWVNTYFAKAAVFAVALCCFHIGEAQSSGCASFLFPNVCPDSSASAKHTKLILHGEQIFVGGILTSLGFIWYGQQDGFGKFNTFNDANEWLQMDKVGHLVTAFHFVQGNATTLGFFGVNQCKAAKYSFWNAVAFRSISETLDGFSPEYGFSFSDVGANAVGLALGLVSLNRAEENRWFNLKYSYGKTQYPTLNPSLLGNGAQETWLKDYNGQTYWFSAIPGNINGLHRIPKWLGVAAGYGVDGLVNATQADQLKKGFNFSRQRQYYVGLDIHPEYFFPINSRAYKVFKVISFIKIPLPGLRFDKTGMNGKLFLSN